jgi:hypothetical protein
LLEQTCVTDLMVVQLGACCSVAMHHQYVHPVHADLHLDLDDGVTQAHAPANSGHAVDMETYTGDSFCSEALKLAARLEQSCTSHASPSDPPGDNRVVDAAAEVPETFVLAKNQTLVADLCQPKHVEAWDQRCDPVKVMPAPGGQDSIMDMCADGRRVAAHLVGAPHCDHPQTAGQLHTDVALVKSSGHLRSRKRPVLPANEHADGSLASDIAPQSSVPAPSFLAVQPVNASARPNSQESSSTPAQRQTESDSVKKSPPEQSTELIAAHEQQQECGGLTHVPCGNNAVNPFYEAVDGSPKERLPNATQVHTDAKVIPICSDGVQAGSAAKAAIITLREEPVFQQGMVVPRPTVRPPSESNNRHLIEAGQASKLHKAYLLQRHNSTPLITHQQGETHRYPQVEQLCPGLESGAMQHNTDEQNVANRASHDDSDHWRCGWLCGLSPPRWLHTWGRKSRK